MSSDNSSAEACQKGVVRKNSQCRVIRSRYREAAARVATNSSSSSNSNSGLSSSNKKSQNVESSLKRRNFPAEKPSAARCLVKDRNVANFSSMNNSGSKSTSSSTNSPRINIDPKTGNVCQSEEQYTGVKLSILPDEKFTPPLSATTEWTHKLHSTAVNATLLNTSAFPSSHLSSTVLGNRQRVFSSSFPELPDISAIKLDPSGSGGEELKSSDSVMLPTILSASATEMDLNGTVRTHPKNCDVDGVVENCQGKEKVTAEQLECSYLNYMTWCYLNAKLQSSHSEFVLSAMKELCFLEELVASQRREESELQQKLQLIELLSLAQRAHDAVLPMLQQFNDGDVWSSGLECLARQLEHHLHQLVLSPAILPDSSDDIVGPLKRIATSIQTILERLQNRSQDISDADSAITNADSLLKSYQKAKAAACVALQKRSLELENDSLNNAYSLP